MMQKVTIRSRNRGWPPPFHDWKTLSVNPAVNGYHYESGKDKDAKRDGWALPFISCAQDKVGH